jgi:hypothetical protein
MMQVPQMAAVRPRWRSRAPDAALASSSSAAASTGSKQHLFQQQQQQQQQHQYQYQQQLQQRRGSVLAVTENLSRVRESSSSSSSTAPTPTTSTLPSSVSWFLSPMVLLAILDLLLVVCTLASPSPLVLLGLWTCGLTVSWPRAKDRARHHHRPTASTMGRSPLSRPEDEEDVTPRVALLRLGALACVLVLANSAGNTGFWCSAQIIALVAEWITIR